MAEYVGIEDFVVRNHSSRVIPLWVNGRPALKLTLEPKGLDFGGNIVGLPSEPMKLTITNIGFADITFGTARMSNPEFELLVALPEVLKVNESLDLFVVYTPVDYVASTGVLYLDLGGGVVYEVELKGLGSWDHTQAVNTMLLNLWGFLQRSVRPALVTSGPQMSLSNTSVQFADPVEVGAESPEMTVTISNAGNKDLVIGDLLISGDYEIIP